MPADNIKRAIQKGTGEIPGMEIVETSYEGYGPAGIAVFVEATTDNKNRTTSEIRHLFDDHGGNLGESGSVAWMFDKKGYITIPKTGLDEEKITNLAIDCGAEDIKSEDDDFYEIYTAPADLALITTKLTDSKIKIETSEFTLIPKNTVTLDEDQARKCLALVDALDEHDDVKSVNANFDIPKEIMEKVSVSP
jgi:YebC/PmpR family DNA-binding regulatory protein